MNHRVLDPDEDVTQVRQHHRRDFLRCCKQAGVRPPDTDTLSRWWPGTH